MIIILKENHKQLRLDDNDRFYAHYHQYKIIIKNSMEIKKCDCGLILSVQRIKK